MTNPSLNEGQTRSVLGWALGHVGRFFQLLLWVVVAGLLLAVARRQFHWRAFGAGLALMLLGIAVLAGLMLADPAALRAVRGAVLWGGFLGTMLTGGATIARVGRRLGYWECYLATLVVAAVLVIHLARGWHVIFALGPGSSESYLDLMGAVAPGVRYLGPMWDRLVGLALLLGFLVSIVGGSAAFLFYSETGRRDTGFELERLVGLRHLGVRGLFMSVTAVVAIIGIALGVAALVAVTAVMSGYQEDIQEKILSTNAHLVVQKYGIDFTEYEEVSRAALDVDGVEAATPFVFNEGMLSAGERGIGVLLKGIDPTTAAAVTGVESNLCVYDEASGRCVRQDAGDSGLDLGAILAPEPGVPAMIVGAELFKKLGRRVGASVALTTPVGIAGARGDAPRRMEFRIAGVFRSGMHEFDSRLVYLELTAAQQLMGLGAAVTGVELRVRTPETVERTASQVLSAVGRYPYRTLDWRELNSGIFTALKLQKIVMFLVLTFIVIVASFNIASTLFMAVVEKAREIAVLKSMGARDSSIMKIFVLQGWLTGSIGTAAGLVLGLAVALLLGRLQIPIAADVYMVESLQVRVRPLEVAFTVAAALAISHLATLYPALKAARQRPVDAMRYE